MTPVPPGPPRRGVSRRSWPAELAFHLALLAYPRAFRRRFGAEMRDDFRRASSTSSTPSTPGTPGTVGTLGTLGTLLLLSSKLLTPVTSARHTPPAPCRHGCD